jgi:hypothetical protein
MRGKIFVQRLNFSAKFDKTWQDFATQLKATLEAKLLKRAGSNTLIKYCII